MPLYTAYQELPREDAEDEKQFSKTTSTRKQAPWNLLVFFLVLIASNACTWLLSKTFAVNAGIRDPDLRTPYGRLLRT